MDPKLFKLLGWTVNAPVLDPEDQGGSGDDDGELEDGESEDGEDEESDEDDESEDDEDKDLGKLSQRTQKRIQKLVGENKDLRRQLEDAQKLGGKDGEAIVSAATKAGIMPSLMKKELADGLRELAEKKSALAYFQDLLDSDEDEFEIGGKQYSRRQLERKERTLTDEIRSAESKLGPERDKAIADAKALFELGLAAKKAGWKPGKDGKEKKRKLDGPTHHAKAGHKKSVGRKGIKAEDVATDDDLEAYIAAERRSKKGK